MVLDEWAQGWHPAFPGVAGLVVGGVSSQHSQSTPSVTKDAAIPRAGDTGLPNPEHVPHSRETELPWGSESCGGHAGEAALRGPLSPGLTHAHRRPQRAEAGPDA